MSEAFLPLNIKFKRTHWNAKLPVANKQGDVGFDLSCYENFVLYPGQTLAVNTGLQVADLPASLPTNLGYFLKIESRSGLAIKGIVATAGIIDLSFRGNICVILHNSNLPPAAALHCPFPNNASPVEFKAGDRIAQLIVHHISSGPEVVFEETDVITETVRNAAGFGSSGR